MIAEILAKNPKYLIFDEPTTMIDSIGKEKIYKIIKNLKQQGYTIICITNLADEILLADRTLVLEQGKIALEIKREELVEKAELQIKEFQKQIEYDTKDYTIELLIGKFDKKDFFIPPYQRKFAPRNTPTATSMLWRSSSVL